MLIVDAHQDLAWSMLTFGRDYTLSAAQIRQKEIGTQHVANNDDTMIGWPEYQRGQVALVFATLFATPIRYCVGAWDKLCYVNANQAARIYREQLDVYKRLADEHSEKFQLIKTRPDLSHLLDAWKTPPEFDEETGDVSIGRPVGLVVMMEGAEAVQDPAELEEWWQEGVRIIGPAWSKTRYCGGTKEPGPMTPQGFALLERMSSLGYSLDLTHMDEQAAFQALDTYDGQIIASHSNAQALIRDADSNRHLSDRVIHGILERDGVIGIVPFNAFLKAGWVRGDRREEVKLDSWIAQIDYICQLAGDAFHVGIGSDFDGGFGLQSVPLGLDTIADLRIIVQPLAERGYSTIDIAAIMGGNWLAQIQKLLPERL